MMPAEILLAIGVARDTATAAKHLHKITIANWRHGTAAEGYAAERDYERGLAEAIHAREHVLTLFKRWTWSFLEIAE